MLKFKTMIRGFKGSLFLVVFLALMVPLVHGGTLEVGSGYDYLTIQSAIDAASDGDTVIVYSGVYPENVVIDKPLTLTGDGEPVIESQGGLNAVSITVDGVVFRGFIVTDAFSGAGVSVESSGNVVSDNKIENSTYGIYLVSGSSENEIHNNNITDHTPKEFGYGIYLDSGVVNNLIHHNILDYDIGYSVNNAFDMNDPSTNTWYDDTVNEGNTYSDYSGVDADEDGIGDTPYTIDGPGGAQDPYPLMPPPPASAPTITSGSLTHTDITYQSAVIQWTTDQASSDHRVLYGYQSNLSDGVWSDYLNGTDSVSIQLTGLTPNSTVYYQAYSYNRDDHGLFSSSNITSFDTPRAPIVWHVDDDLAEYPEADYQTIMEAVNASISDDAIVIHEGYYVEDVVLEKKLNLTGINYPKIEANLSHGVHVKSQGCVLENLNITAGNSYDAVHIGYPIGFFWSNCGQTLVTDCELLDSQSGVYVNPGSNDCNITQCNIKGNGVGVHLYRSDNNLVNGSDVYYNGKGVVIQGGNQNTVSNSRLVNNSGAYGLQIYEYPCQDNRVEYNHFVNNELSIKENVVGSVITRNGFSVESSPSTPFPSNYDAISLHLDSSGSEVSHNTINGKLLADMGDHSGILLDSVSNCTLLNNTVRMMYKGVSLISAENVTMRENTLYHNNYNFHIEMHSSYAGPIDPSLFVHDIDTSNTVEGKEIHYYVDQDDLVLSSVTLPDVGYLAVVNGRNIRVSELVLTENSQGILLFNVENTTVENVYTWGNHLAGVMVYESSGVTIVDSRLKNNGDDESIGDDYSSVGLLGIRSDSIIASGCEFSNNERIGVELIYSTDCEVTDSEIIDNGRDTLSSGHRGMGIRVDGDSHSNLFKTNIIKGETIDRQYYGIWLGSSTTGNTIYDNVFDNDLNARDLDGAENWNLTKTPGINILGGNYLGGNRWSDYSGGDTDYDGLGDTDLPYTAGGEIGSGGDFLPLTTSDDWVNDGVPPTIFLVNPVEGMTLSGDSLTINVSSPDLDVDRWWYVLDNGPDTGFTPGGVESTINGLSEGDHTIEIHVADVFDNQDHETVNFDVDIPEPSSYLPLIRPPMPEVPPEEAEFQIAITPLQSMPSSSRALSFEIFDSDDLLRKSYSLDGGVTENLNRNMISLERLTVGEHSLEVYGESYDNKIGYGVYNFTVIPVNLDMFETYGPEYVDDIALSFISRDMDCILQFEGWADETSDVDLYVNNLLRGTPGSSTEIDDVGDGEYLGSFELGAGWREYTLPLNRSSLGSGGENILSFIHSSNPGASTGLIDWSIRNVVIRYDDPINLPEIQVSFTDRAITIGDHVEASISISGVTNHTQYDSYLYLITPEGGKYYYPDFSPEPHPLDDLYLMSNYNGIVPGQFESSRFNETGLLRLVGKVTLKGDTTPLSLSNDNAYFHGNSSVRLFLSRDLLTDGAPLSIGYAYTNPDRLMNNSIQFSVEDPNENRVYYPEGSSYASSTKLTASDSGYVDLVETIITPDWVNGTYIIRASLFDQNDTLLDDDLAFFDVARNPVELRGRLIHSEIDGDIVYSEVRVRDAYTLESVYTKITDEEHETYSIVLAPGLYVLSMEVYSNTNHYYVSHPSVVRVGAEPVVYHDIDLGYSNKVIDVMPSTQIGVNWWETDETQKNLLYSDELDTILNPFSYNPRYVPVQDAGSPCSKPIVYVTVDFGDTVLSDLLDEYPGDTQGTLNRFFSAKLANMVKRFSPGVKVNSFAGLYDGLEELESNIEEQGNAGEYLSSKVGFEYLLSLKLDSLGNTSIVSGTLYDLDNALVVGRQHVTESIDMGIFSVATGFGDLGQVINSWEISHSLPPRDPRLVIDLSKDSVTAEQGQNQLTITVTATNCKGEPVEDMNIYFSPAGKAISGSVPRGRVEADGETGGYVYAKTNGDGVAQATYTLYRGINSDTEEIDVHAVGRGNKRVKRTARFDINGVTLQAWAEESNLGPLEETTIHVKLFSKQDGEEVPLAGRKIYYDDSDIRDSKLLPLGETEGGLLVTDANGEARLRFIAGEKEGQIGVLFRYNLELNDPQFPGFAMGDHVVDKAILEVKADEFLVYITWGEDVSWSYNWYREHHYDGWKKGEYHYSMKSKTIWDRQGGKEDSDSSFIFDISNDFYEHENHAWTTCDGHWFEGDYYCDDYRLLSEDEYTSVSDSGRVVGEFDETTINMVLKKDAQDNLYVRINPVNIPFRLSGQYMLDSVYSWIDYEHFEDERTGDYYKVQIGSGSVPRHYDYDYSGKSMRPYTELTSLDVLYRHPALRGYPSYWYGPGFRRGVIKIEKTGESTYKPYRYKWGTSTNFEDSFYGSYGARSVSRIFTIRVIKR